MEPNSENQDTSETKSIFFKKRKRPNTVVVKKITVEDVEKPEESNTNNESVVNEDSVDWTTLAELRELRKAKRRINKGIDVEELLKDPNKKNEETNEKGKHTGGLTDANTLASELDLGNTFSLETNRRDEDAELMRYVEEELNKRRKTSKDNPGGNVGVSSNNSNSTQDLLIKSIPDHLLQLIKESKSKNEEMLSSQMLSGIPEVDLGIEERIRNIEKTEAARTKLLEERLQKGLDRIIQDRDHNQKDVSFAPKNLASCFTNRNQAMNNSIPNHRFNLNSVSNEHKDLITHFIDKEERIANKNQKQKQVPEIEYEIEPVVVIGDEPQKVRLPKPIDKDKRMPAKDKPLDNYIFEKFKKNLKRK